MSREELVNLIIDLSNEDVDDSLLHKLACESYKELVRRLGGIAQYHVSQYNLIEDDE